MSQRARQVLRAIDAVASVREHHPRLYVEQLRDDRTCGQLLAAWEQHKRLRREVGGRRADRDEVERVPSDWEERHADQQRADFERTRRKLSTERREQRKSLSLLDRHRRALAEIAQLSTVSAGNVEPSRAGSHDSAGIEQLRAAAITLDLAHAERLMEIAIAAYEAELDEALGFGLRREINSMFGVEKDALIIELEGWTPSEIEVIYQGKLGSAATVRRVRRGKDRDPLTGVPLRFKTWGDGDRSA